MMVDVDSIDPQAKLGGGLAEEGPAEFTEDNVQHWCKHARQLEKPHVNKAKRLLCFDCVRYVGDDNEYAMKCSFIVLPLNTDDHVIDDDTGREFFKKPYPKDYNSTLYTIVREEGRFVCNCQGWSYRERRGDGGADGCSCSHVLALFFCFKIGRFRR